ncbi:hypothetical protein DYB36_014458 [Aphanomyces astaci]|uniref:Uncharacterized protein n=1 Tax=Aphanomyces astaci TaxID=112090 RepID=A0A396ZR70_APHAT|nr:hypothetical protein DYB36_014458 [Aphanomyces astaci]
MLLGLEGPRSVKDDRLCWQEFPHISSRRGLAQHQICLALHRFGQRGRRQRQVGEPDHAIRDHLAILKC